MKAFSVGLNLDASIEELKSFFVDSADVLYSVYYSLPLGKVFYTRKGLDDEYRNNEEKLLKVIDIIRNAGIKTEIALNTRLDKSQIETAIEYIKHNQIIPDEIACRNYSLPPLKSAFPNSEFISCYNNGTEDVNDAFDSIVLGQRFLRNPQSRQKWVDRGFRLILLLNNGCSFQCDPRYCNSAECQKMYINLRNRYTASQIYAIQSFFPEELRALCNDPAFFTYRFKLSTRPLGLQYTSQLLKTYAKTVTISEQFFRSDYNNYLLFGALTPLAQHFNEMSFQEIMEYKKKLSPLKTYDGQ